MIEEHSGFRILQSNLHKHKARTYGILNDTDMKDFTMLLLQEQYWSPFTKSSLTHHSWTLFEPEPKTDKQPRTAIYTNNTYLAMAKISQLHVPSSDITAIQITLPGDSKPMLVINVYNPCDESVIPTLHHYLEHNVKAWKYGAIIMAGDFNCHHPMWNPRGYTRHDDEADSLIELASELDMSLLLPPGTITYPNAGTTIDLV